MPSKSECEVKRCKECESEMYIKEKEKYEMLLTYVKAKYESEMRKHVKVKVKKC